MTCVVGLVEDGVVYMGADSAGVAGWDLTIRSDPKVFRNGDFLIGFTTSYRMGQLLRYAFTPPRYHDDEDVMAYMVGDFVEAVRACLQAGGVVRNDNGVEEGGSFLVGYLGRLFEIESDFQVGESVIGYKAVGCGDQVAHGVLYATKGHNPAARVGLALEAAEAHSAGVRAPFVIEVLGEAEE